MTDQEDTAKRRVYWRKELRAAVLCAVGTFLVAMTIGVEMDGWFLVSLVAVALGGFIGAAYRLEKYGPDGPPRKRGWLYRGANRVWHFGWRVFHRQDAARDLRLKNRTPAS